jgi:hypothetical protein
MDISKIVWKSNNWDCKRFYGLKVDKKITFEEYIYTNELKYTEYNIVFKTLNIRDQFSDVNIEDLLKE